MGFWIIIGITIGIALGVAMGASVQKQKKQE